MVIHSFYDLFSLLQTRPKLFGPYIMAEFTFLGYFSIFERFFSAKNQTDVIILWTQACQAIHPTEPRFSLYCLETSNPNILKQQIQPDTPKVFDYVSKCLRTILFETKQDISRLSSFPLGVSSAMLNVLFEHIHTFLFPHNFFYHKGRAYEAFLLGLLSAYEYLSLGSFQNAMVLPFLLGNFRMVTPQAAWGDSC